MRLEPFRPWIPPIAANPLLQIRGRWQARRDRTFDRHSPDHWLAVRGAYTDRECHVLGNGPSLSGFDPQQFAGDLVITMNGFGLHPRAHELDVDYHCMADPRSSIFNWQSLDELTKRGYVPPRVRNVVVHPSHLPHVEWPNRSNPELLSVSMGRTWSDLVNQQTINFATGIGNCQSTAILAISLAIHLGCRLIYLHGMEHDFLADHQRSKGAVVTPYNHFYHEDQLQRRDGRNLAAVSAESSIKRTYLDHISLVREVFQQHAYLATISKARGSRIMNLTPSSFLDSYDN